jgi:aspartate aminotransferase-like enzyme
VRASRERLLAPGPTPIPLAVLQAQVDAPPFHRGPPFRALMERTLDSLRWLLETEGDVLCLTASGTGALEAAVVNVCSPGDTIVVAANGFFGDRVTSIAEAFGVTVVRVEHAWGDVVAAAGIGAALDEHPTAVAVVVQHSETSTGVVNDIDAIAAVVTGRDPRPLLVVDAISAAGAVPIRMDERDLDVVCVGSQKGLGAPPGLSFVAVSERAWAAYGRATCPRYYWDFEEHRKHLPETPWTPATTILAAVDAALTIARETGREALYAKHVRNAAATRAGVVALGLELFGTAPDTAVITTAFTMPDGISPSEVAARVRREHGLVLAAGQGQISGGVLRIGHLGHVEPADIVAGLAALGATLAAMGADVRPGAAVDAALGVFSTSA